MIEGAKWQYLTVWMNSARGAKCWYINLNGGSLELVVCGTASVATNLTMCSLASCGYTEICERPVQMENYISTKMFGFNPLGCLMLYCAIEVKKKKKNSRVGWGFVSSHAEKWSACHLVMRTTLSEWFFFCFYIEKYGFKVLHSVVRGCRFMKCGD